MHRRVDGKVSLICMAALVMFLASALAAPVSYGLESESRPPQGVTGTINSTVNNFIEVDGQFYDTSYARVLDSAGKAADRGYLKRGVNVEIAIVGGRVLAVRILD